MGILSSILGGAAASPISAVGNVLDSLFTSDEERLDKKIIMERLAQQPHLAQVELNKIEAQHRSLFVAGWRPFIGWVCGVGLGFNFIAFPLLEWGSELAGRAITAPTIEVGALTTLVVSLLGLGGMRSLEKFGGRAK